MSLSQIPPILPHVMEWTATKNRLREKLGEKEWSCWIEPLRLLRVLPCSCSYAWSVADHFQRRRNSNVLVSSLDWLLIETWTQIGVPGIAIERGIDAAFHKYGQLGQFSTRQINSLAFCESEVLRAMRDMREARIGESKVGAQSVPSTLVEVGHTFLVALPPSGKAIFSALQNRSKLLIASLALTVYPDKWQQHQAQQRFGQDLTFLDPEVVGSQLSLTPRPRLARNPRRQTRSPRQPDFGGTA